MAAALIPSSYTDKSSVAIRIIFLCLSSWPVPGQQIGSLSGKIEELGVGELLSLQITSVNRKAQKLAKAPAAVFVITQEDIRRSGATSLPEVLRLAPGLHIGRVNGTNYAVGSRGHNGQFSNKLLVMIDGRTIYTPLFAGTHWQLQDMMLEDIERIEVIRGPNPVSWGSNAVNGVINVITRSAKQTQGGLATVTAGTEDRLLGSFRYGGKGKDKYYYRIFGRGAWREVGPRGASSFLHAPQQLKTRDSMFPLRENPDVDWNSWRSGFRVDFDPATGQSVTIIGELNGTGFNQIVYPPSLNSLGIVPFRQRIEEHAHMQGGFILGRWSQAGKSSVETTLQTFHSRENVNFVIAANRLTTSDMELQQRKYLGESNELSWAFGLRRNSDVSADNGRFAFFPQQRANNLYSAVIRDEQLLMDGNLMLSFGTRLEHNGYTGAEIQPSVRALYSPVRQASVWAAWSRAVRIPSRGEHDVQADLAAGVMGPLPTITALRGNPDFQAEVHRGWEAGLRLQSGARWSLDIASFYSNYYNLPALAPLSNRLIPGRPPLLEVVLHQINARRGTTYGLEAWAVYNASPRWRLVPSYAHLVRRDRWNRGITDFEQLAPVLVHGSPEHTVQLRSLAELPHRVEFDWAVSADNGFQQQGVRPQLRLDAHLGWRPRQSTELALAGRNLTNFRPHLPFRPDGPFLGWGFGRSVMLRWTFRF